MEDRILIFIPMYRCEKQIPRVIAQIAALGEKQKLFSGMLVVDNRSPDASVEAAVQAIKTLEIPARVVQNRDNYSLGGSHKVAFNYALDEGYTHVVVLHGDDQGSIADIVPIIEKGGHREYDSLLGSRFLKDSRTVGYSNFRIFGNHVFNAAVSILAGRRIADLGSGLNLYKTEYLKSRFYTAFPDNLTFNVYLLLYGVYAQSRFAFFPITWREEDQISNARLVSQSSQIMGLALEFFANRKRLFARMDCARPGGYYCDTMADNGKGESV